MTGLAAGQRVPGETAGATRNSVVPRVLSVVGGLIVIAGIIVGSVLISGPACSTGPDGVGGLGCVSAHPDAALGWTIMIGAAVQGLMVLALAHLWRRVGVLETRGAHDD